MEPTRKAPYGVDLRWRVVWLRICKELYFEDIGRRLGIAKSTAHRIFAEFADRGAVDPKGKKGLPRRYLRKMSEYEEMFIVGLVLESPALYLKELCSQVQQFSGIEVCEATICNVLHRHGLTRKKIRQVAIQRSVRLRVEFMTRALMYKKELFVWLDETGCDNRSYMRKYGYAIRGDVPVCRRLLVRGQRISAIAAIATDGIVSLELYAGTTNSDIFYDFVRGSLIPQMSTFNGTNHKSIVIMDNCSIHHVPEVKRLFLNAGILVIFLPPYSPDYNPIEEASVM